MTQFNGIKAKKNARNMMKAINLPIYLTLAPQINTNQFFMSIEQQILT